MPRSAAIIAPGSSHVAAKKRTVAISLLAAAVITGLKLWTGLVSGSLGMLSEAAHSGLDLLASLLILISVTVSDRPADEAHSYGHGKMENLAAFTETLLMLLSVVWILVEAGERLMRHHAPLRLSIWPFAVLILSIGVDFFRSRELARVARLTRSQALEADSVHFGMDIWSSAAVMVGLLAVAASQEWRLPWLRFGDPLAAIAVSAIILKVCWRLARQTVDVLTDAAPLEIRLQVSESLRRLPEDFTIERVRLRLSGNHYFADLTVSLPRTLSFQRIDQMKDDVAAAVHRILPDADVVVSVVPRPGKSESIFDRVRAVAARHNLTVHDVSVKQHNGKLHLEQHLEVGESLNLREAHALVSRIEMEMRRDVPQIESILTHIESEQGSIETEAQRSEDRAMEAALREASAEFPDILDVHDVLVSSAGDRVRISCHCTLPDDLSMKQVHALITALEDRVKENNPRVAGVFIHPEPAADNAR